MEIRQLRYFHALSEELHFGRAAARERIGQPALSLQISQLERELGVRLFERSSRRVRLTEPGKMLVERAQAVLQEVNAFVSVAGVTANCGQECLRISCIVDCGSYDNIADTLDKFRAIRDNLDIELNSDYESAVLAGLRRGTIDVGITWLPTTPHANLHAAGLVSERLVTATPKDHPLARREFVTAEMVVDEPLVLPSKSLTPSYWNVLLVQLSGSAGAVPRVAATEPTPLRILQAVGRGHGLALMPESLVSCFHVDGVTYLPWDRPSLGFNLGILWRKKAPKLVRSFVEHMRKSATAWESN